MGTIHCGPNKSVHRTEKIQFPVSGWDSLRCTPTVKIRPDLISIEYSTSLVWVKVRGRRINVSGLGATHDRPLWQSEWPEWLATEVKARAPEWWDG